MQVTPSSSPQQRALAVKRSKLLFAVLLLFALAICITIVTVVVNVGHHGGDSSLFFGGNSDDGSSPWHDESSARMSVKKQIFETTAAAAAAPHQQEEEDDDQQHRKEATQETKAPSTKVAGDGGVVGIADSARRTMRKLREELKVMGDHFEKDLFPEVVKKFGKFNDAAKLLKEDYVADHLARQQQQHDDDDDDDEHHDNNKTARKRAVDAGVGVIQPNKKNKKRNSEKSSPLSLRNALLEKPHNDDDGEKEGKRGDGDENQHQQQAISSSSQIIERKYDIPLESELESALRKRVTCVDFMGHRGGSNIFGWRNLSMFHACQFHFDEESVGSTAVGGADDDAADMMMVEVVASEGSVTGKIRLPYVGVPHPKKRPGHRWEFMQALTKDYNFPKSLFGPRFGTKINFRYESSLLTADEYAARRGELQLQDSTGHDRHRSALQKRIMLSVKQRRGGGESISSSTSRKKAIVDLLAYGRADDVANIVDNNNDKKKDDDGAKTQHDAKSSNTFLDEEADTVTVLYSPHYCCSHPTHFMEPLGALASALRMWLAPAPKPHNVSTFDANRTDWCRTRARRHHRNTSSSPSTNSDTSTRQQQHHHDVVFYQQQAHHCFSRIKKVMMNHKTVVPEKGLAYHALRAVLFAAFVKAGYPPELALDIPIVPLNAFTRRYRRLLVPGAIYPVWPSPEEGRRFRAEFRMYLEYRSANGMGKSLAEILKRVAKKEAKDQHDEEEFERKSMLKKLSDEKKKQKQKLADDKEEEEEALTAAPSPSSSPTTATTTTAAATTTTVGETKEEGGGTNDGGDASGGQQDEQEDKKNQSTSTTNTTEEELQPLLTTSSSATTTTAASTRTPRPPPTEPLPGRKVAYMSRSSGRTIADQFPFLRFLKRCALFAGAQVIKVQAGGSTIDELFILLSDAKVMIGMHGADLTNMVFQPQGSALIEMNPIYFWEPRFPGIAQKLNISYHAWNCGHHHCAFKGSAPDFRASVISRGEVQYNATTFELTPRFNRSMHVRWPYSGLVGEKSVCGRPCLDLIGKTPSLRQQFMAAFRSSGVKIMNGGPTAREVADVLFDSFVAVGWLEKDADTRSDYFAACFQN